MDRQPQSPTSMTTGTMSILDKVSKGYTQIRASSRGGRHSTNTPAWNCPRTAATEMPGKRPLHEPFLDGAVSAVPPFGRGYDPRSRSANHSGSLGGDQRHQQQELFSRLLAAQDENDMVGRWDYASSEDHVSTATASGLFQPAVATGTSATAASGASGASGASCHSIGSASITLAIGSCTRDTGDQQVHRRVVPCLSRVASCARDCLLVDGFRVIISRNSQPIRIGQAKVRPGIAGQVDRAPNRTTPFRACAIPPPPPTPGRRQWWRWLCELCLGETTEGFVFNGAGMVQPTGGAVCYWRSTPATRLPAESRGGRDGGGGGARRNPIPRRWWSWTSRGSGAQTCARRYMSSPS